MSQNNGVKKIALNTSLTAGQASFALMLEKAPYLESLWNMQEREYIPEKVDHYLETTSHNQAIMARFFLGVWQHDNELNFNLIESVRVLDKDKLIIIMGWMAEPFWP